MIVLDQVTVTYEGEAAPALREVSLSLPEGELCLVVGPTGVGKSTLLGAISGLVPHFTGGHLQGRVTVAGRDTAAHRPRDLADIVGVVGQDPAAGFVAETVERELAFAMEQLGLPADTMRRRVEEVLDLMGIAELRDRPLHTLSGGQQQRVAIGAVLTAQPEVLVLDEPTSALDPAAAEDVLAAVTRLVHDLGITAVVAEHRLERILGHTDHLLEVRADGTVASTDPATGMRTAAVAPPVVALGRWAGWADPLPLHVRDARRRAAGLRAALPDPPDTPDAPAAPADDVVDVPEAATDGPALSARGVRVRYDDLVAVRDVDVDLAGGQVVALMGRNGAGKSSLLWALQGSGRRDAGTVAVEGTDPAEVSAEVARRLVALVPQTPSDLLYRSTVAEECAQADRDAGAEPGRAAELLADLVPGIDPQAHPRDLSEGQRLAVVLAVQLVGRPSVLLLDEPTRGLDYDAKDRLAAVLRRLAGEGTAVVVSTHDVEFVAGCADRVVVMADGEVVADGPTAEVVVASPVFAPQVAKVLRPSGWLTVAQLRAHVGDAPGVEGAGR